MKKYYKWEVLALLWVAYLLNQADRQVFNTVLPAIRDSLNLTDTSVGLIATVFNLFHPVKNAPFASLCFVNIASIFVYFSAFRVNSNNQS